MNNSNLKIKKENKLYNLENQSISSDKKSIVSNEDIKKIKVFILIILGLFLTIFLFGAYIFYSYDIDYTNTAFEKQDMESCYMN